MSLFTTNKYKCSVSSVLNKDVKQHGKSFLFDGMEDTAWSSDQGTPQHITVVFDHPLQTSVSLFAIQFQGGFAGKDCIISLEDDKGVSYTETFYPDDINAMQKFTLKQPISDLIKVRITFRGSTDFFGRIIVYNYEIY